MTRRVGSLQRRLAWRIVLVLVLSLVLGFAGFVHKARVAIDRLGDASLQAQAAEFRRHIAVAEDGSVRVELPETLMRAYERPDAPYFYALYGPSDRIVATSSDRLSEILGPYVPPGTIARLFRVDLEELDGPYYGYVSGMGGLRFVVAQGRQHADVLIDSLLEEFFDSLAWWAIPVILLAAWIGIYTVRNGLAPLRGLSQSASAIGPAALDRRLAIDDVPSEVRPLVEAINDALDRVAEGFQGQRRFTAEVAHQLRTPLALIRARLDAADPDDSALTEGLQRDVRRLEHMVGQLLRAAKVGAADPDLHGEVDLCRIATAVVDELAPLAEREGRDLALGLQPGEVRVRGDAELITVAVANLVENALTHTPAGTSVEVHARDGASIAVADDGPGIPAHQRGIIFERFRRLPEAALPGAGLGLAMVADVARLHGGRVEVRDRPGGGIVFELLLPQDASLNRDAPEVGDTSAAAETRELRRVGQG